MAPIDSSSSYRLDGELKYSNFSFNTKMLSHLELLLPAKQKVN